MRHLHPLAWAILGVSFATVIAQAGNVLVTALALTCIVVISKMRQGPREAAFGALIGVGVSLLMVVLVIGLFTGAEGDQTAVLFRVPNINLGTGGEFGGIYTVYRLVATASEGLKVLSYCAIAGLLSQACPAGQWCDFAEALMGRGAIMLAPLLCLGEATVHARAAGQPWWQLPTLIAEQDAVMVASWRRYSRTQIRRPAMASSLALSVGVVLIVFVVLGISFFNGIPGVVTDNDLVSGISAFVVICCCWVAVRLSSGRARLAPPITGRDGLAMLAALLPGAAALAAGLTGDINEFDVAADTWPGLPIVTLLSLLVATVAVIALQNAARANPRAVTRASAGAHA